MTGIINVMPSEGENKSQDPKMVADDAYDIDDGDNDIGLHDDYDGARNEILVDASHESLVSGAREMSPRKKAIKNIISLDTMCGQFATDANSTVGVDVSCGAIPSFTKEVPYNSAGLSLVDSVEKSPSNGFFSPNHRRRKRPTRISSMPAASPNNDTIIVERRLRASDIMLTSNRRKRPSFRPSNPRVERFNYAKALLRSDKELERLSRTIRSEINESELFELAQAAEKAAALGVDNFSGRASTFGGEQHRKGRKELEKTIDGSTMNGARAATTQHNTATYSLAKIPTPNQAKPQQLQQFEIDNWKKANRNSEQSLLDHARAAAAAVVVAKQAVQLQSSATEQIRREPEKRSMGIDSLRDVNEVIPVWKELHHHMRTHFYRASVEENSLFFSEPETISAPPTKDPTIPNTTNSASPAAKENIKDHADDQRKKSFLDNLTGMKLLPNFQPKESPLIEDATCESNNETEEHGTFSVDDSEALDLSAPLRLINSDECLQSEGDGLSHESKHLNGDKLHGQATHLAPRLPRMSEGFNREVMQISTEDMPVSLERSTSDDESSSDSDDDDYDQTSSVSLRDKNVALRSQAYHEDEYEVVESAASSAEEKRESSLSSPQYEQLSPASPSKSYILGHSSPQFPENASSAAPSTPTYNVIPPRRSSGFSTPVHLRVIKRIHSNSVSEDNRSSSNDYLNGSKPERSQSVDLQEGACASTPATSEYAQFEPNSIVQKSSGRSPQILTVPPSFEYAKAAHLDLPTIPSMKGKTERQKVSRNFGRRIDRAQWKAGSVSPPNSPIALTEPSKLIANEGSEDHSFLMHKQTQSRELDGLSVELKTAPSSKTAGVNDQQRDAAAFEESLRMSILKSQHEDAMDEKKECDNATTSSSRLSTCDDRRNSLSPMPTEESSSLFDRKQGKLGHPSADHNEFVSSLRKRVEKSKSTTKSTNTAPLANGTAIETFGPDETSERKELELNHSMCTDESSEVDFDKISVCHSMPQTEVSFKIAVQTVQGVAAQTVQEVFSHLSLGGTKSEVLSREWQAEGENKEYLSNYFYCAKTTKGGNLRRSSLEVSSPLEDDSNGLVCAEPCNDRDFRCHMFGIDTMCGGLIDLLPNDVDANEKVQDKNGILSQTPTRDRTSSISTDKINRNQLHSNTGPDSQEPVDETWLGMVQKVASERLNLQFQTDENEMDSSRHRRPYTPPGLSRKLPNPNQTI